jgi:hypothetical protein
MTIRSAVLKLLCMYRRTTRAMTSLKMIMGNDVIREDCRPNSCLRTRHVDITYSRKLKQEVLERTNLPTFLTLFNNAV